MKKVNIALKRSLPSNEFVIDRIKRYHFGKDPNEQDIHWLAEKIRQDIAASIYRIIFDSLNARHSFLVEIHDSISASKKNIVSSNVHRRGSRKVITIFIEGPLVECIDTKDKDTILRLLEPTFPHQKGATSFISYNTPHLGVTWSILDSYLYS